jgi:hypothetical protein
MKDMIVFFTIGLALGGVTLHAVEKNRQGSLKKYACQMGWRYSALKYKVLENRTAKEIIADAEKACEGWQLDAFIERHM